MGKGQEEALHCKGNAEYPASQWPEKYKVRPQGDTASLRLFVDHEEVWQGDKWRWKETALRW